MNQAQKKQFLKKRLSIIEKYKGSVNVDSFKFKTNVGTLNVTFRENDAEFIPMIFESDFDLDSFLDITHDHAINKHSFKWNIWAVGENHLSGLEILEKRLAILTE